MPRYTAIFTVDATISVEVDAPNIEEAKKIAKEEAWSPSLCHGCSKRLEVGDVIEMVDINEESS